MNARVGGNKYYYLQRDNLTYLNSAAISLEYSIFFTPIQFGNLSLAVVRKWKTMTR